MYCKEYGITEPEYMQALWCVRGYAKKNTSPKFTAIVSNSLQQIPEAVRPLVIDDIVRRVNIPENETELKVLRDKLLISVVRRL